MDVAITIGSWALAAMFLWAAVAKTLDQDSTRESFETLGLVAPRLLSRLVPIVEVAISAALVFIPAWGGIGAFGLLVVFTAVLIGVLRSGRQVRCACFGSATNAVVSGVSVVRNFGLLIVAAVIALWAP